MARLVAGGYFACILTVSCSDVWDTSVFDCILLVSCLYRVGYFVSQCHATFMCEDTFVFAPRVLYLDRIRWFPDSRTGIHPEYIRIHQNTSEYIRIHQNTVFIENPTKSHRKPPCSPGIRARRGRSPEALSRRCRDMTPHPIRPRPQLFVFWLS